MSLTKDEPLTKDEIVAANRESWNEAAAHHREHDQWASLLKGFAEPGFSVLDATMTARLQAIGLEGKAVAQLCCNNARELLSIKNLGSASATGFDFAQEFLDQGRELAAAGGIEADFVQGDINEIPADYDGRFDLAVVTIGVFGWMPDLAQFFATARRILKPGGRLFIYEDHPILNMYDDRDSGGPPQPDESYFRSEPYRTDTGLDYWAEKDYAAKPNYWIFHKMSDVIMALVNTGFAIEDFEEFPHNIGTRGHMENQPHQLPLSYVLVGRKEG